MPRDRLPSDDPGEWINRAQSHLRRAKVKVPDVNLENLCFDAQQAEEKAIKAVLIASKITFPPVHDLARLLTLLEQAGEEAPPSVERAAGLTRFAVATRYPGFIEPVTLGAYEEAVEIAEQVVG